MYCEVCIKTGKINTFTTGCTTYKTSSMIRHEATADHKISVAAPKLNNNMTAAINNVKCKQDEAIIKTLKLVNWFACENVPLSKFESLMNLLKELIVPGLGSLNIGDRIDYNSYYTAQELLEAISDVLDLKNTTQLKESPYISLFADLCQHGAIISSHVGKHIPMLHLLCLSHQNRAKTLMFSRFHHERKIIMRKRFKLVKSSKPAPLIKSQLVICDPLYHQL